MRGKFCPSFSRDSHQLNNETSDLLGEPFEAKFVEVGQKVGRLAQASDTGGDRVKWYSTSAGWNETGWFGVEPG